MRSRTLLILLALASLPLHSSGAQGIGPSGLVLRTSVGLALGVDTNPLRRDGELGSSPVMVLRLRPELHLETVRPRTVDFVAQARASVDGQVAGDERLETGRASSVDADVRVGFWPRGPVTVTVHDRLLRTPWPLDIAVSDPSPTLYNRVGIDLATRTEPVYGGVGYAYGLHRWSDRSDRGRDEHTADAHLGWRFARHALLEARVVFTHLTWTREDVLEGRTTLQPLTARLAIEGHAGQSWWGRLEGGYADTLTASNRFQQPIGTLEMGWDRPGGGAVIGVSRELHPSLYARWYSLWSGYARGGFALGPAGHGRTHLQLSTTYGVAVFGHFAPSDPNLFASHDTRTGQLVSAGLALGIEVLPWLRIDLHYDADVLISNFRWQRLRQTATGIQSDVVIWNYQRHVATLQLTIGFDSAVPKRVRGR